MTNRAVLTAESSSPDPWTHRMEVLAQAAKAIVEQGIEPVKRFSVLEPSLGRTALSGTVA